MQRSRPFWETQKAREEAARTAMSNTNGGPQGGRQPQLHHVSGSDDEPSMASACGQRLAQKSTPFCEIQKEKPEAARASVANDGPRSSGEPQLRRASASEELRFSQFEPECSTVAVAVDEGKSVEARDGGAGSAIENPSRLAYARAEVDGECDKWPIHLSAGLEDASVLIKTCTRWWNSKLSPRFTVHDLCSDLCPGVLPLGLVESLRGIRVDHIANDPPSSRFERLENWVAFLELARSELRVPIGNVGAEGLAEGNTAQIVSLTWTVRARSQASSLLVGRAMCAHHNPCCLSCICSKAHTHTPAPGDPPAAHPGCRHRPRP